MTDAWDPDKPLPPEIIARLLASMRIKEHLPGQHDQDDHGKWAADRAGRDSKSKAENAIAAGAKIKRVTSGGDQALTLRRYGVGRGSGEEFQKMANRLGDLRRANNETFGGIRDQLTPVLTKLMAETPFAGNEERWLENATDKSIKGLIASGLTDPADIAAANRLLEVRTTERAIAALSSVVSNAPEHRLLDENMMPLPKGETQETYFIEDVDGKSVGIVQYVTKPDDKTIEVKQMVELGVARGMVTMAVGAAMKQAAEKGFSVIFPGTYISARASDSPSIGVVAWKEKLQEIGVPFEGIADRGAAVVSSAGDVKDWTNVALERVDKLWGLPSTWKKDPTKPFDAPPSQYDTHVQQQAMIEKAKATPTKGQKLSFEEIETVKQWQSMNWRGINKAAGIMSENPVDGLVGSDLEGSDLDIIVGELDAIAERNTAEEDWILWRGVSAPGLKADPGSDPRREAGMIAAIRGAGEGGIIESGKFVSMTTDEAVAASFADDRMLRINVPAATRGFWIENLAAANPDLPKFLAEKEFVTARGTKYRVDKIVENHPEYGFFAELTVIP